jgi:hypothetical protein
MLEEKKIVDTIYTAMQKKFGSTQSIYRLTDPQSPVNVKN